MTLDYISDDTLFLRLYNENYSKINAYCHKRLNRRHDLANDCVQNTFFAAFQSIGILRTHENPAGWLFKTAKNHVLLAVRQIKREQSEVRLNNISKDIPSRENFVERVEVQTDGIGVNSSDILRSLSERERTLHKMFYVDKLSSAEIAAKLEITDGACRMRLYRLREKIYAKIQKAVGK